jgi:chemotaxis protein MotB
MSRGKRHDEEHSGENHERWMVTYADMVTLLMVLFIIMLAMSEVDKTKYDALKQSLSVGFGAESPMDGAASPVHIQTGSSASYSIRPTDLGNVTGAKGSSQADAEAAAKQSAREGQYAAARNEADRLEQLRLKLLKALSEKGLQGDVRTAVDGRGLTVSLISEHVVFNANRAELTERGQRIVDTVGPILADVRDDIEVGGHTNQEGGRQAKYYDSDWDLASARAVTVLRNLNEKHDVPDTRLRASSFGKTKPLVDPAAAGSQRINKRVDIVVLARLAGTQSELLAEVAGTLKTEGS